MSRLYEVHYSSINKENQMAEMQIALDLSKNEAENLGALLVANGTKDYHVSELEYGEVTVLEGQERNTSVHVSVNANSVLASTNGPWDIKYNRLPFIPVGTPVITGNGDASSGLHMKFAIEAAVAARRGQHATIVNPDATGEEFYKAYTEAPEEDLAQGYINSTVVIDPTSKILVKNQARMRFPVHARHLQRKDGKGSLGYETMYNSQVCFRSKHRADFEPYYDAYLNKAIAVGSLDEIEKEKLLRAAEVDSSVMLSASGPTGDLNTAEGYAHALDQTVRNFGIQASIVRPTAADFTGGAMRAAAYSRIFDWGGASTGIIAYDGYMSSNNAYVIDETNNYEPNKLFTLRGGLMFATYGIWLAGQAGTKCAITNTKDTEGKIIKTTVYLKKSLVEAHSGGIDGALFDALLEVTGQPYVETTQVARFKEMMSLTVTIDKAAATARFKTTGANLMFWGNEFVHYAVTDDGLDPDEPVIIPQSSGGFLEPEISE